MQKLNWDRICVLVVDDNTFMLKLLVDTLKTLGITDTVAESDCAGAIRRLKLSRTDPAEAGLGEVDLIMSDYLMPAVDGNLFLRWIRTGDGVPDRFVPFIMVSGAADQHVVEEARDAGVTEFLAKPYSAKAVALRLLSVINNPRPFVLAQGFFGPDRRRSKVPVRVERRRTRKSEIQVVKPDSTVRTLREDVREIHFRPNNRLRHKLGPNALRRPVEFDPLVIKAAEERIKALVGDYADWTQKYLNSMQRSLTALRPGKRWHDSNRKHVANINRIAHELRGQGGTFDYPLITSFGKSLFETTINPGVEVTENRRKLIAAHIDAIRTVFKNRIQGDGGEVGLALLREIDLAVKKYH